MPKFVRPRFSIVVPTRNEEANVERMASTLIEQMALVGEESFDIIFIDNASDDRTVEIVKTLAARDSRIRLIVNARNFGQMRSPTHGIFQARGEAIISLCADFQDPPTLIPAFVERWRAGTAIVLGVREAEATSARLAFFRKISYWFAAKFNDYPVVRNATGFGLYDAKVVQAIKQMREPEPFFRGMLVETGYSIETIPYFRPPRLGGRSNNNFFALLDFMLSSLASGSKKVIRLPFYGGAVAMIAALLTIPVGLVATLLGASGWTFFWFFLFEFHFALLYLALGVLGDQVRLISERTRQTPLVIERERINFPDDY